MWSKACFDTLNRLGVTHVTSVTDRQTDRQTLASAALSYVARPKTVGLKVDKQLSYRRETALQGGLVIAKSGRLELEDNIYGHLRFIFNHCDVFGQQRNRNRRKKNTK